jgi:thiol-disulfide isomerase/thioredoxin
MLLDPPLVHAPDLQIGSWINAASPSPWDENASATLVEFWEFTCVNCHRTLPYLRAWHRQYAPRVAVVGIHTAKFSFGHDSRWVLLAARRLGLRWPIAVDYQQSQWTAWAVKAWPTLFLVDCAGYVRLRHSGDRGYPTLESALRTLMREANPGLDLPEPVGILRPEDEPNAVRVPVTPELQADDAYRTVGPRVPPAQESAMKEDLVELDGGYRLEGDWVRADDGWFLRTAPGAIILTYSAAQVHAVLAPDRHTDEPGAPLADPPTLQLELDGGPLEGSQFGSDVFRNRRGTGLRLDAPRLYNLVRESKVSRHELRLGFDRPGSTFYAFSFGSCVMPSIQPSPI